MKKQEKNQIEYINIDKLIPYARNARKHSEAQVQQIAASIKEFGFLSPCIIADDYTIIVGHGRILGANKLNIKEVPCIKASHLTEAQRRAYGLVDNRLNETSSWDNDMLKIELEDLTLNLDFDMGPIGFSAEEIESLLKVDEFKPDLPDDNEKKSKIRDEFLLIITCDNENEQQRLWDEFKTREIKVKIA